MVGRSCWSGDIACSRLCLRRRPISVLGSAEGAAGERIFVSRCILLLCLVDMVSATQKAQPRWMTPLVTVTPRLEQEFRWDFYDQKNGTGPQGNGQNIITYGGPSGARLGILAAYNWEVIVAAPSWATASGPRGDAEGWADWPAFLVKYRLLSANAENGDYIVTAFFQMSDPLGTPGNISNNVLTAQPTLAFGKGWGDFDIQ